MLVVDAAHKRRRGWKHLIDKDEDSLLRRQLDAFANNIYELADGEICRNQILLLVDGGDVGLFNLFADNLFGKRKRLATSSHRQSHSCKLSMTQLRAEREFEHTGMRSEYFWRIRSASALRFSKGCSSLNLDRMMRVIGIGIRNLC